MDQALIPIFTIQKFPAQIILARFLKDSMVKSKTKMYFFLTLKIYAGIMFFLNNKSLVQAKIFFFQNMSIWPGIKFIIFIK